MLIYRIENEEGLGAYQSWAEGILPFTGDIHQPSPQGLDLDLRPFVEKYRHWKFAFASIRQYERWVYRQEWREALDAAGGFLSVYSIPSHYVFASDFQAIYDPAYAILFETRSCSAPMSKLSVARLPPQREPRNSSKTLHPLLEEC